MLLSTLIKQAQKELDANGDMHVYFNTDTDVLDATLTEMASMIEVDDEDNNEDCFRGQAKLGTKTFVIF